jgi:large subunit ribosomal protein L6
MVKGPVLIPEGVTVNVDKKTVIISGPHGQVSCQIPESISVEKEGDKLLITRSSKEGAKSLYGLVVRMISNAIKGVKDGWTKTLELVGTGYRARLEGQDLILSLGFSHPVKVTPPAGITFSVTENKITVSGADKALVGQVAANIRKIKPPEPYQGKGVRYEGEVVRRKAGKSAKTASA